MKHFLLASLLIGGGISSFAQEKNQQEPFKPSGKLWGYAFGDFAYKVHADELNRGSVQYSNLAQDYNSFDFRRIYLGYNYDLSEKFSAEILLAYEGNNLDAAGNRTVLIKAANLRWKNIYKNADLIIGQSLTPTFDTMEKIWGYRSIEKTITDMRPIAKASDLGVALRGKFDEKGTFGYNLMVADGTGTKPETDKYKKLYSEIYGKLLDKKLLVSLHFDYEGGKSGDLAKDKTTLKLDLAYQTEPLTIGFEVFQQSQNNAVAYKKEMSSGTTINDKANYWGTSVFVRGILKKDKLNFFARYDFVNPDANFVAENIYSGTYSTNNESFITAGLDFTPIKNVHFMPNIWLNTYQSKVSSIKSDNDLVARATFYYVFGK